MFPVANRRVAALIPVITRHILLGTTIVSDLWRAYNNIPTIPGMNYTHETVNHSESFVDPNTGANTQRIERSWKSAKERNKRHNGTHRQMLDSYMCEYMWRHHVKIRQGNTIDNTLDDIMAFWPPR